MANYSSMAAMMGSSKQAGAAPIPTTTFAAQNIIGTPLPQVGDAAARPNYAGVVGQQVNQKHVVIVALAVIVGGYLLYHFTFEK